MCEEQVYNNEPISEEIIIHGEQVPVITLTRRQLEEDWYTLHSQLQIKKKECKELEKQLKDSSSILSETEREFYRLFNIDESIAITDHKLLKLICVAGNFDYFLISCDDYKIDTNQLKLSVLGTLSCYYKVTRSDYLYNEVQRIILDVEV